MSDTNTTADSLAISPIDTTDISAVANFLHKNMNSRFSVEEWAQGLNACWLEDAPNHGFMLRDNHQVVGVICAIYSVNKTEMTRKPSKALDYCVLCLLKIRAL